MIVLISICLVLVVLVGIVCASKKGPTRKDYLEERTDRDQYLSQIDKGGL